MRRFKQATAVALSVAMVMTSVFTTNVSADAKTKKHGTLALDRGVNIMTKLRELLQIRNIRLENSEKII